MENKNTFDVAEYRAMVAERNKAAKPGKYKSVVVKVDGISFHSKKEAAFYGECKIMKLTGQIKDFTRQNRFDLVVNDVKVGYYKADFVLVLPCGGKQVIDVKSDFTRKLPMYRKNKKLMLALYGITIVEK